MQCKPRWSTAVCQYYFLTPPTPTGHAVTPKFPPHCCYSSLGSPRTRRRHLFVHPCQATTKQQSYRAVKCPSCPALAKGVSLLLHSNCLCTYFVPLASKVSCMESVIGSQLAGIGKGRTERQSRGVLCASFVRLCSCAATSTS